MGLILSISLLLCDKLEELYREGGILRQSVTPPAGKTKQSVSSELSVFEAVNRQNHGVGWAQISLTAVFLHHGSQSAVLL